MTFDRWWGLPNHRILNQEVLCGLQPVEDIVRFRTTLYWALGIGMFCEICLNRRSNFAR